MAINLTKVLTQIQNRISDSTQSDLDLNKLIAAANRINNSGTQVLTYKSTGHLPSLADSRGFCPPCGISDPPKNVNLDSE